MHVYTHRHNSPILVEGEEERWSVVEWDDIEDEEALVGFAAVGGNRVVKRKGRREIKKGEKSEGKKE